MPKTIPISEMSLTDLQFSLTQLEADLVWLAEQDAKNVKRREWVIDQRTAINAELGRRKQAGEEEK